VYKSLFKLYNDKEVDNNQEDKVDNHNKIEDFKNVNFSDMNSILNNKKEIQIQNENKSKSK